MSYQCQWAQHSSTEPQCTKPSTRKIGDNWFCEEHGNYDRGGNCRGCRATPNLFLSVGGLTRNVSPKK